jgi:GTP-binding protein Era
LAKPDRPLHPDRHAPVAGGGLVERAPTRAGRVALVGRPNVGKSTLLNHLVGEPLAITSRHPQTTREPVRGVLTRGSTQYVLVDTPGLHEPKTRLGHRMNGASRHAAREADVVVLLAEAVRDEASRARFDADLAVADEIDAIKSGRLVTVLAITKIDRIDEKGALLPLIAAASEKATFAAIVPLSAKRDDGTEGLLDVVGERLPEQPFLFEPDTLTDQPMRFFAAELVREQILARIKQEVPHGVAVVVDAFDEQGTVARIDATIHVAREAHKKILVGAQGRMVKAIGTAARANIERLLGRRVHLDLRVRATPGWMDDEARLRELGFEQPDLVQPDPPLRETVSAPDDRGAEQAAARRGGQAAAGGVAQKRGSPRGDGETS